jgi:hypothetical protein
MTPKYKKDAYIQISTTKFTRSLIYARAHTIFFVEKLVLPSTHITFRKYGCISRYILVLDTFVFIKSNMGNGSTDLI